VVLAFSLTASYDALQSLANYQTVFTDLMVTVRLPARLVPITTIMTQAQTAV
jgi:hypothetical protein